MNSPDAEILAIPEMTAYIQATLHCTIRRDSPMIALIEKFLDALFAPLAREIERLPPQALRFTVFF